MPVYRVWSETHEEDEADGRDVEAISPQEAAEEWTRLREWSACDFSIAAGRSEVIVNVREGPFLVTSWRVEGDPAPRYQASPNPALPEDRRGIRGAYTITADPVLDEDDPFLDEDADPAFGEEREPWEGMGERLCAAGIPVNVAAEMAIDASIADPEGGNHG